MAMVNAEYLLAELRCARLRAQVMQNEFDSIGIALRDGLIDAEQAVMWLRDSGLMSWIHPHGMGGNGQ